MSKGELKKYKKAMEEPDRDKRDTKIRKIKISDISTNKMNEYMIKVWNKYIKPEDVVLHLGDFYLGSKEKRKGIRDRLNGTIILIHGSHDGSKWRIAKDGFIVSPKELIIEDMIFTHKPIDIVPDGKWNVHGHIHNHKTEGRRINVSVEQTDYKPININELRELINWVR